MNGSTKLWSFFSELGRALFLSTPNLPIPGQPLAKRGWLFGIEARADGQGGRSQFTLALLDQPAKAVVINKGFNYGRDVI